MICLLGRPSTTISTNGEKMEHGSKSTQRYERNCVKPKGEKQHPAQALSTVNQPRRLAPKTIEVMMLAKKSKDANGIC